MKRPNETNEQYNERARQNRVYLKGVRYSGQQKTFKTNGIKIQFRTLDKVRFKSFYIKGTISLEPTNDKAKIANIVERLRIFFGDFKRRGFSRYIESNRMIYVSNLSDIMDKKNWGYVPKKKTLIFEVHYAVKNGIQCKILFNALGKEVEGFFKAISSIVSDNGLIIKSAVPKDSGISTKSLTSQSTKEQSSGCCTIKI